MKQLADTVAKEIESSIDAFADFIPSEILTDVVKEILRREITRAVEATKGYRTDTEYVSGQSLEDYLKENGL